VKSAEENLLPLWLKFEAIKSQGHKHWPGIDKCMNIVIHDISLCCYCTLMLLKKCNQSGSNCGAVRVAQGEIALIRLAVQTVAWNKFLCCARHHCRKVRVLTGTICGTALVASYHLLPEHFSFGQVDNHQLHRYLPATLPKSGHVSQMDVE